MMSINNSSANTFWKLVDASKIIIPPLQRDYAQGRDEVERVRSKFLNALYKALIDKPIILDFIYGDIK